MDEYSRKRDFSRTPEPPSKKQNRKGGLIFVVQKHAARRLHYDLRLEMSGVLKSWALPHGPSLDPTIKRLAVMVEDHPADYAGFEGIIPTGQYGAGQVIIWDRGTFVPVKRGTPFVGTLENTEKLLQEGLNKGKIIVFFYGQKLKGEFTLVKMQRGENNWLFLKHRDAYADASRDILEEEGSVASKTTIAELKASGNDYKPEAASPENLPGARPSNFPVTISPMLATLASAPFTDPEWIFEPKLDGYRTLAFLNNGKVKLQSRRGVDMTSHYAAAAENILAQQVEQMVLDGEIIALDEKGKICFQCLQNYLKAMEEAKTRRQPVKVPLVYYIFDLLYLNGYDLQLVPYEKRARLLREILLTSDIIRPVEQFSGDGDIVYNAAVQNGLEGIIAKRLDSIYQEGRRSRDWLKIKGTLSDEFVIGGYSQGMGNRAGTFGALLLGQFEKKNKLVYSGHVGTGFDEALLKDLSAKLIKLKTPECPFTTKPPLNARTVWVKPELVAEIKYSERTNDGILRAPVFLRLRDDKPAEDVKSQIPISSGSLTSPPNSLRSYGTSHVVSNRSGITIRKDNNQTNSKVQIINTKEDDPDEKIKISSSAEVKAVLEQLKNEAKKFDLTVKGEKVTVNNLDKPLWPAEGDRRALTKRDLLEYLTRVSPYLLPHLKDRLITLSRYPDGINGEQFYQKHWPHRLPDFVTRLPIPTEHEGTREYLVCDNLPTLLWLGQLADIELHTWFSRVSLKPDPPDVTGLKTPTQISMYPDFIIFDLDPYLYSGIEKGGAEPELNRHAFEAVCETALWFKDVLNSLSLEGFLKTSGKTGLHIYVPIKRQLDYDEVRSAARTICLFVNNKHLKETTVDWAVGKRTGKIFLDFNQNTFGKTLASVYSPRPTPLATVSMPIQYSELGKIYPTDFTILNAAARLQKTGDLWAEIMDKKRDLKKALGLSKS